MAGAIRKGRPGFDSLMRRLVEAAAEYCGSEHFLLLDENLQQQAEPVLEHWCRQLGDDPTVRDVTRSLDEVAHLDLPLAVRPGLPTATGRVSGIRRYSRPRSRSRGVAARHRQSFHRVPGELPRGRHGARPDRAPPGGRGGTQRTLPLR